MSLKTRIIANSILVLDFICMCVCILKYFIVNASTMSYQKYMLAPYISDIGFCAIVSVVSVLLFGICINAIVLLSNKRKNGHIGKPAVIIEHCACALMIAAGAFLILSCGGIYLPESIFFTACAVATLIFWLVAHRINFTVNILEGQSFIHPFTYFVFILAFVIIVMTNALGYPEHRLYYRYKDEVERRVERLFDVVSKEDFDIYLGFAQSDALWEHKSAFAYYIGDTGMDFFSKSYFKALTCPEREELAASAWKRTLLRTLFPEHEDFEKKWGAELPDTKEEYFNLTDSQYEDYINKDVTGRLAERILLINTTLHHHNYEKQLSIDLLKDAWWSDNKSDVKDILLFFYSDKTK